MIATPRGTHAITLLLLGLASGCSSRVDLALYSKFQAAQDAFDAASSPDEFARAAALYQEILDSGVDSGAVYYNQGNAFMRAGHRGRAIACYRQAKRYRPRDPYLDANLRAALDRSVTRPRPLIEYILFWQDWVSYPGKFQLCGTFAAVTFLIAVASLFAVRSPLQRLAVGGLLLTTVFISSAAYDWYRFSHRQHGVVITDEVIARKGNGDNYEPAFTKPLIEGTEFQVLAHRATWYLIRPHNAPEGWVKGADVVVY